MSDAVAGPFVDEFSKKSGGVWTITLDAVTTQLAQLAHALKQQEIADELSPPTVNGDTDTPAPKTLDEQEQRAVFAKIASAVGGSALKELKDQELVAFSNLYASVAFHLLASESDFSKPLSQLAEAIVSVGSQAGVGRYQALVTLFNALPAETSSTLKFTILSALLRLAASETLPSTLETVRPVINALPSLLVTLQTPASDADAAVSSALVVAERDPTLAYSLLKAYLATPTHGNDDLRAAYLALSLRLPKVFDFPSLASGKPEAELASLVLAGKSAEVAEWSNLPDRVGDKEALVTKARSVAIARALADKTGQTVSYEQVQRALGSTTGSSADADIELEGWVIDAIKSGLVAARLSQPRRQISVLRVQAPSVGAEAEQTNAEGEWRAIQTRLTTWKDAMDRMIETVRTAAGQHAPQASSDSHLGKRTGVEIEAA